MNERLQDPMFFYAVAFFIFMALAYKFGRKPLLGWLDSEIVKIRTELDQARQLRAEAEASLASCKAKQAAAEADARAILSHAQEQVATMRKQAETDLAVTLKRHEQLAGERIRMAEAEAIALVRRAAVDMAVSLARKNLSENVSDADATRLIDQAIAEIPTLKPAPAKAA